MEKHEMAEKLVSKCGISYEEAGEILREANYDMLEAMIILERRGRLGQEQTGKYSTGIMSNIVSTREKSAADAESFGEFLRLAWVKLCEVFGNLLKYNIVITNGGREVAVFPLLLAIIVLGFTAGLAIVAVVFSIIGGCSYEIRKIDE